MSASTRLDELIILSGQVITFVGIRKNPSQRMVGGHKFNRPARTRATAMARYQKLADLGLRGGVMSGWYSHDMEGLKANKLRAQNGGNLPKAPHFVKANGHPANLAHDGGFHLLSGGAPTVTAASMTTPATGNPTFWGTKGYIMNEGGEIYSFDESSPATPVKISTVTPATTGEKFHNAEMQMWTGLNGDLMVYAVSDVGTFYVHDITTDSTTDHLALGGVDSNLTNLKYYPMHPQIDVTTTIFNPGYTFVYAATMQGTLHEFIIDDSTQTISVDNHCSLPSRPSTYNERYAATIYVDAGQLAIASWWWKITGSRSLDKGAMYVFDTTNFDTSLSIDPTKTYDSGQLTAPIKTHPLYDMDGNGAIFYGFSPVGDTIGMFNIIGGSNQSAYSTPLGVENGDSSSEQATNTSYDPVNKSEILSDVILDEGPPQVFAAPFELFVAHANALWKISYGSATYDTSSDPYVNNSTNWMQRSFSFGNSDQTTYCKTNFGLTSTTTTASPSGKYIANTSYPSLFADDSTIWVLDNNDAPTASTGTSWNQFSNPNRSNDTLAPQLDAYYDLSDSTSATQLGSPFISYDYNTSNPVKLLFGTGPHIGGTGGGKFWVFDSYYLP